jgi:hypothetical protein
LADLAQRTGIAAAQLARHVAALYMVGSVTANRKRLEVQQGTPDSAPGWNASSCPADGALGAAGAEMTVRLKAAARGSALPQ